MLQIIMDGYLNCVEYENKPMNYIYRNVTLFHVPNLNRYFFALIDSDGKVLLKSAGYLSMKSCETGLNSVLQNFNNEYQYIIKEHNRRFYLSLCSEYQSEIARSSDFYTRRVALEGLSYILKYSKDDFEIEPIELSSNENGQEFEYSFITHKNGLLYFEVYYQGCIFLRSKSYKSDAVRDFELKNVQNLIMDENSYEILCEGENKDIYIVVLLDDLGRELARSFNHSSVAINLANAIRGKAIFQ